MRPGFNRFLSALAAVLFVGAGIALLLIHLQNLEMAKASVAWLPAEAIVLETDYERGAAGRKLSNGPYVTYQYRVSGQGYVSNVFSFSDSPGSEELLERYPKGRSMIAYYNPARPWEATLVKGVGASTISGLRYAQLILGMALLFSLHVSFTEIRRLRRRMLENRAGKG